MTQRRHPKKPVQEAIEYALSKGWRLKHPTGHPWGGLYCQHPGRQGCIIWVWSTPMNADNHAKQIRRRVDSCPHS